MHKVISDLKGEADWVVSGHGVLHSLLIILRQRDPFTLTGRQHWDVHQVDLQQLCSPRSSRKQPPALACIYIYPP